VSDPFADRPFPRGALLGAAALVGVSLIAVASARLSDVGVTHMPQAAAVVTRNLRFEDRADGAVAVYDAAQGDQLVELLPPGTNGFLRGVMRGMARERRREGIGAMPPFELTRWSDGRLSMQDPKTGVHVNLEVFGPTNVGVFVHLLNATQPLASREGNPQ
jgi:putative photosynthetic complex assembly protein